MSYTCQIKKIFALLNKEGALNSIQWFKDTLYELSYDYYNSLYSKYYFEMQEEDERKFTLPQDPELLSSNVFINNKKAHDKTIKKLKTIKPIRIIASNPEQSQNTYINIMEIGKQQEQNRDMLRNISWWKFKMKKEKNKEIKKNEFHSCIDLSIVLSLLAFYYCEKKQLGSIDSFNNFNHEISQLYLKNIKY